MFKPICQNLDFKIRHFHFLLNFKRCWGPAAPIDVGFEGLAFMKIRSLLYPYPVPPVKFLLITLDFFWMRPLLKCVNMIYRALI